MPVQWGIDRYAMNDRMTTDRVIQALFRATDKKLLERNLIFQSVQSSQYCAPDCQEILKQFDLVASMSGKGDNRIFIIYEKHEKNRATYRQQNLSSTIEIQRLHKNKQLWQSLMTTS